MNQKHKSVLSYFMGAAFYLPVDYLNSFAGGQWLTINEIYFAPFIALSMFFVFASVAFLNPRPLYYGLLSTIFCLAMIFTIPNVSYPIGSAYYESVEANLSRLSGTIYAMGTCLYCLVATR